MTLVSETMMGIVRPSGQNWTQESRVELERGWSQSKVGAGLGTGWEQEQGWSRLRFGESVGTIRKERVPSPEVTLSRLCCYSFCEVYIPALRATSTVPGLWVTWRLAQECLITLQSVPSSSDALLVMKKTILSPLYLLSGISHCNGGDKFSVRQ